jgi:putative oxidoreductase
MSMNALEKLKPLALLGLRVALGAIFIYHGYPKLFSHSHEFLFDMSSRDGLPGYVARLAGIVEVLGGAMLAVGVFTRFVGLLVTVEVALVLWMGHQLAANPRAVGRYEFPLVCMAAAFTLATIGAGPISMDAALFRSGGRVARKVK